MSQMKEFLEKKIAALKQEQTLLGAHLSLNEKQLELLYEMTDMIQEQAGHVSPKKPVIRIQPATLAEAIIAVLTSRDISMTSSEIKAAVPGTGFTGKLAGNKVSATLWQLAEAKKISKYQTKPISYASKK